MEKVDQYQDTEEVKKYSTKNGKKWPKIKKNDKK